MEYEKDCFCAVNKIDDRELAEKVEKYGMAVIVSENAPKYAVITLEKYENAFGTLPRRGTCDLWTAIDTVLLAHGGKLHAGDLAAEIDREGLYYMKDGSSVKATQVRARAEKRPERYGCLKGNYIALREAYATKLRCISDYREREVFGGVFGVRNKVTGKVLLCSAGDLHGCREKVDFAVATDSPTVFIRIQEDWRKYGAENFEYVEYARVKREDESREEFDAKMKLLYKKYAEQLGDKLIK